LSGELVADQRDPFLSGVAALSIIPVPADEEITATIMKPRQLVLISLLLPPLLNLCAAAGSAGEATVRGEPIVKEDFERWPRDDKVLFDENRRGFRNLRCKTWGDNHLLLGNPEAPDITCDPALKGVYDIEVESRATDPPRRQRTTKLTAMVPGTPCRETAKTPFGGRILQAEGTTCRHDHLVNSAGNR